MWDQIELTPPHMIYLTLPLFMIVYVLFAKLIKNIVHLSEPPLALIIGIILGPAVLGWLTPNFRGVLGPHDEHQVFRTPWLGGWGWSDNVVQETTRVIVCLQVFSVGIELPKHYARRKWKSVLMMLGPVMTFGWLVCALFTKLLFQTDWSTAFVVSACLTPTDPVLSASILSNSDFSERIPPRLKNLLSAESGCNDGISFPFLFIGLSLLQNPTNAGAFKEWILITVLWQCVFGTVIGFVIGHVANKVLRFSVQKNFIDDPGFVVYYFLLAIFCAGVGSTLGTDDFLVAFTAGYAFARDGWFAEKTKDVYLNNILDLLLNSAMFIYLGAIIPWYAFQPQNIAPWITPGRLVIYAILVLLFRRIPVVCALYKFIPDIHTFWEALFCGHFGPMGLGAIFLAIEARAQLENGTSIPDAHPPHYHAPYTPRQQAVEIVWPLVCFIVMMSTFVHGFSVIFMTGISWLRTSKEERGNFFAPVKTPLQGMDHDGDDEDYGTIRIGEHEED